jgi:hypothetical protein
MHGVPIPSGRLYRLFPGGRLAVVHLNHEGEGDGDISGSPVPGDGGTSVGIVLSSGDIGCLMQELRKIVGAEAVTPQSYRTYQDTIIAATLYNMRCIAGHVADYAPHGLSGIVRAGTPRTNQHHQHQQQQQQQQQQGVSTDHAASPTKVVTFGRIAQVGSGRLGPIFSVGENCIYSRADSDIGTPHRASGTPEASMILLGPVGAKISQGAPAEGEDGGRGTEPTVGALNVYPGGAICSKNFHPTPLIWSFMCGHDSSIPVAKDRRRRPPPHRGVPRGESGGASVPPVCDSCKAEQILLARDASVSRGHVTTRSCYTVPTQRYTTTAASSCPM